MGLWRARQSESACSLPAGIFPCQAGKHVLERNAQGYVAAIRGLISAPIKLYNVIYFETLCRFAELCQSMPADKASGDYSLLTQHLKHCIGALKLRRKYLLPPNADSETIAEQEPQWTYAIFSASLCCQLHRIQQDRHIILHNKQGKQIGQWQPLDGKFYEPDRYFSLQWDIAPSGFSVDEIMSTLVNHIVPAPIMQWLAQNSTLFALWRDVIKGTDTNNILGDIIQQKINSSSINKADVQQDNQLTKENDPVVAEVINDVLVEAGSTEQVNVDPIESLLTYLSASKHTESAYLYLRIEHGLFISLTLLNDFISQNQQYENSNQLIELIKPALVDREGEYCLQCRPKEFGDRRVLEGIVLAENVLNDTWKNKPVNFEFQPAKKL